jgi:hypothetical protein
MREVIKNLDWRNVRHLLAAFLLLSCASCVNDSPHRAINENRAATPEEIAAWRKKHGFVAASEAEIAEAKRMEKSFENKRAVSANGKIQMVFKSGQLVGDPVRSGASTTSTYQLLDASDRELISAPSRVVTNRSGPNTLNIQLAWFAADGSQALLYEDINTCNGPAPFVILFYQDQEGHPIRWKAKFYDLGHTLNVPFDEGDDAECRGMIGNQILIRNTREGISKTDINRLKETYPFPWTEG